MSYSGKIHNISMHATQSGLTKGAAVTSVLIHAVDTHAGVEARIVSTVVYIRLTVFTGVACQTKVNYSWHYDVKERE